MNRCHEEFDLEFCEYADAQIQSEGGYNPLRWAEYAEGYCSWGMFQNHVCGHMNWTHDNSRYIYNVLTNESYGDLAEYERLKKFAYLLDGDWQIEELIRRYKARMSRDVFKNKWCTNKTIRGEKLTTDQYCAIRLHNWNGGNNYVSRVIAKRQELYN